MSITKELRAKIRGMRDPFEDDGGKKIPGSVRFIRELLPTADSAEHRDELLVELGGEYLRADLDNEHLLVQRERVANQPGMAIPWIALSRTLSRRPEASAEAKAAAEKAVAISRTCGTLVRYALLCQAEVARQTCDSALFAQTIEALIVDARNFREDDVNLDDRIVADLPEGFCDPRLEARYRELLVP